MSAAERAHEARTTASVPRLRQLAADDVERVRQAAADNPNLPVELHRVLLLDRASLVRITAASRLMGVPELHDLAAHSDDPDVRRLLAASAPAVEPGLTEGIQETLATDPAWQIRQAIAERTTSRDIFERLLGDADPRVRGWCAANPRITRSHATRLVADRSAVTRRLVVQVCLRYPDPEQLVVLARDHSAEVQWAVAMRIDVPRRALELIAQHGDAMNRHHARLALQGIPIGGDPAPTRRRREVIAAVPDFDALG